MAPIGAADRADKLHALLKRIHEHAEQDLAGGYTVTPVAVEGWLRTAIAAAEQLAAELRGDVVPPGGEHGGPAD
jgi:hypothetical protein